MSEAVNIGLDNAHQRLVQAVEELTSGEAWAAMLAVAARFPHYSAGNCSLLAVHAARAGFIPTKVCGYASWKALGYQVRAGEKGLPILAPVLRQPSLTNRGHDWIDPEDDIPQPALVGFKVVHVFDISQCVAPPGHELPEVAPVALTGAAPEGLYDAVVGFISQRGFALVREPLAPANGLTDFVEHRVVIADRLSEAQATRTALHEAGHLLLHGPAAPEGMTRDRAEVEAESVAFITAEALGMSGAGDYSFPYVAHWAKGDVALVLDTATRAIGAARQITDAIGPAPEAETADLAPVVSLAEERSRRRHPSAQRRRSR